MTLFLDARRQGYTPKQCGKTMTVEDLISFLSNYDGDTPIYLRHDRGYTYGAISDYDFEEEETEDME